MIEWFRRADPNRPFLIWEGRTWSYRDARAEVERRMATAPLLSMPTLTPASVFDVLAGVASGGVTVVGPDPETTAPYQADLVVFTSGTSGPPKGVRLTRSNLEAAARASVEHLGHGPGDVWLLAMPLHHVGGLSIVIRQAYSGGAVLLQPGFEAERFAAAMRGGATMVSVVPTMLRRLLGMGPFHGLRAVLVGGGPIPDGLLEDAAAIGLPVLPTYGMTETFGQVATLRPGSPLEREAHPLPGIELRIEGDGRIAVRGDQVSPGYVGEPDRTDPWFVTSDLGAIEADGALRVIGRADAVIVTGGENVNPEQVEAVLREHEGVVDACVVGVDDDEWGQVVVGVFEGGAEAANVLRWAAERMPAHMVPKRLERMERIPRGAIGKADRQAVARSVLSEGD
ncbi:MAG TPA: AMP-binding protein [Acidimicrobiia bacterium]|nr:AMP-binding protein [Acidimicrobiia bacterium]